MKLLDIERLQALTKESHASSIVYYKGHRVIAWFGGYQEGMDCDIWTQLDDQDPVSILTPKKYTNPNSLWNPILFTAGDDLLMFFKEGKFCDSWQTFILKCDIVKNKLIKRDIATIPAGMNAAVKTKPLQENNLLICGSAVETRNNWTSYIEAYSYDKGQLGIAGRSNPIKNKPINVPIKGLIQPALWKEGNTYHALLRSSTDSPFLYHCQSKPDNPMYWEQAVPVNINNPNSSIDVLRHSNGKLYMAYNPSPSDRIPLVISEFELIDKYDVPFIHIKKSIEIKLESNWQDFFANTRTVELSYPFMIENPDGNIEVSYTFCRKEIRVATIDPS